MDKVLKRLNKLEKKVVQLETEKIQEKRLKRGYKIHKKNSKRCKSEVRLINGWVVPIKYGRITEKEFTLDEYKNLYPFLKSEKI